MTELPSIPDRNPGLETQLLSEEQGERLARAISRLSPVEQHVLVLRFIKGLSADAHKPFLETASYLIAIFVQPYGLLPDGRKIKHYYALESVGIATGVLITAVHQAGLVALTHTPSPMGFLNQILERPANERPFLLLVVGYPAEDAVVPDIRRKSLSEIATFL